MRHLTPMKDPNDNRLFKPENQNNHYEYRENPIKPFLYKLTHVPPATGHREVKSQFEAFGYITKSLTRVAGAELRTNGSIGGSYDMSNWGAGAIHSGFGVTHSAQWRWSNQSTHLFWEKLAEELQIITQ